jgi:carboxymethylenebutenolidase
MTAPSPNPVTTRWIDVPTPDGTMGAYLALPPAGQGPGLLLWQEIFGVNGHIRAVAEQYALDGFVVLAPDVFWRQEPRLDIGYTPDDIQHGRRLAGQLQPAAVRTDIEAALASLRGLPAVGGRKVGSFGYCMGGRLAYLSAAFTDIDAAVAYYGGGIQGQLDKAAAVRCPMQFHYAEHDDNIPPAAVEAVRAAMAGRPAEVFVYPGAHHGFNCWARGAYHPASAALARGRTLAFLGGALF